ncbi:SDR family oxidoreductase [Aquirufa antheringensis]
MKNKVVIIGSNGMAGHLISDYLTLNPKFEIVRIARDSSIKKTDYQIDVSDFIALDQLISNLKPDYIINAIGVLNADAENNPDRAVLLNSYFPHFLAKICDKYESRLFHISTDCVFNGKKGSYLENDFKDGIGFYAQSKAVGEVNYHNHITIRTSIIGPEIKRNGIGLLNWILLQNDKINGYSEAFWGGVTTLELAKAIEFFILQKIGGVNIYHLTNSEKISKFDLLRIVNEVFNLKLNISSSSEYKVDKSLVNSNKSIDYSVPSYQIMIEEMHNWIRKNSVSYPQYNIE